MPRAHPRPDPRAQHAPPCTGSARAGCTRDLSMPSRQRRCARSHHPLTRRCARRVQHTRLLRAVRCVITLRENARNHPGFLDARQQGGTSSSPTSSSRRPGRGRRDRRRGRQRELRGAGCALHRTGQHRCRGGAFRARFHRRSRAQCGHRAQGAAGTIVGRALGQHGGYRPQGHVPRRACRSGALASWRTSPR